MTTNIKFKQLRQLLLEIGFREVTGPKETVFHHRASNTIFVFRPYRPNDPVASYNLIEVKDMLDHRELMSADSFENQFKKKTPA